MSTFLRPKGKISNLKSLLDPSISLSYKETHICETTPDVKSYSGYVNLPPNPAEGRDYPIHTFFWFFEARKDPANAPFSLWLQGGPGAPSIPAALGENGPCFVTPDSKGTILNPWSWNNEVNMLYIDQPVQVGFSYETIVNGTIDETVSPFSVTAYDGATLESLETNSTLLSGRFASQGPLSTANSTMSAARASWHFMQIWMQECAAHILWSLEVCADDPNHDRFPKYRPKDNEFSIWGESYAGHYAPTFADFFLAQNKLVANGTLDSSAVPLRLDTVGLVNACIDIETQVPLYPQMAYNNTYGLQIINETEYKSAVESFPACRKMVETCRSLAEEHDPFGFGNVTDVNKACSDAFEFCFGTMWDSYNNYGRNVFDITAKLPDSFPPKYAAGYLNRRDIQSHLGVLLNFTGMSEAVSNGFTATGDFVLGHNLAALGKFLDQGIKVALMYGDRDYQCNWLGGEQISLAIDSDNTLKFHQAGYANIQVNETYVGGVVRQYENLSFSRVFGAGHEASWYQPETAYRIFNRVMSNVDVATGKFSTRGTSYSSKGPSSSFAIKNTIPTHPARTCYFWDILETCTPSQTEMIRNGSAILEDFVMVGYQLVNGTINYY
ncbi:uncharacterized protein Z518_01330 [Rhinocladiella mackenziei CBS 650.93]|uniref:Carboxypeptidase n=1 Tax=Rhinocladiella mackenziei CBS 650.93 TaxID=1442369 RepID=A0A0D2IW28_9EURO|nr:uncharacterized protein Z518_01330 [Rhinocladiella mackenziei CBS 650.93]KIX10249.1 hypothetical protein Z518_01330 [Rhinocladiella mackenziei CBS 650.93]